MKGSRGNSWISCFFLVWPLPGGRREEARLLVLEVRRWREKRCGEFSGPLSRVLREMRDFVGKGRVWMLAHDPSSLHEELLEGSPEEWQWLWGYQLATLLFHEEGKQRHPASSESTGRDGWEDAREQARAYLRMLHSWHDKARSVEPRELREQVAALLNAAGTPWAFSFSDSPGTVRPLAFAETAKPRASPRSPAGVDNRDQCGMPADPAAPQEEVLKKALETIIRSDARRDGLEDRPQQLRMAQEVAQAMREEAFLAVEAGTGIGKSLAYLLPASLMVLSGSSRAVISTHTKGLQDQLRYRDLPRVAEALPDLRFSLLKGRSNYLCLRRWEEWCLRAFEESGGGGRILLEQDRATLMGWAWMLLFLRSTETGDLEELPLEAQDKLRGQLDGIRSLAEECASSVCPHHKRCFVEAARKRASDSHLVVVNHALLLAHACQASDGCADGAVLPPFEYLVVDEAHRLESVATEAFSRRFTFSECRALAEKVNGRRGLLRRCEEHLWGGESGRQKGEAEAGFPEIARVREALMGLEMRWSRFFREIIPGLPMPSSRIKVTSLREAGSEESEGRVRSERDKDRRELAARVVPEVEDSPAWKLLVEEGKRLAEGFDSLATALEGLAVRLGGSPAPSPSAESTKRTLEAWASRLSPLCLGYAETLRSFLRCEEKGMPDDIRWWEFSSAPDGAGDKIVHATICAAPAEVGRLLVENLWEPLRSAVFTSATLRTDGGEKGFSYFAYSVGLEILAERGRETRFSSHGSPFDYGRQARCFLVRGLSEPGSDAGANRRFLQEMVEVLEAALLASRGRGLVLFTSYEMLEGAAGALFPRLRAKGIPCLKQERGSGSLRLLERFRDEVDSVLFATASFWEGVDIPGESLSLLAIARLPFPHPGDPLLEGRREFLEKTLGKDGWLDFYLPVAVMRFRQGVGRLIRRKDDRGVILVLDPRLCTRPYGSHFIASLPAGLQPEQIEAHCVGESVREFLSSR